MNLFDLTGKTAVVIGGNSALGGAMSEAFGAYGARVAVVGCIPRKPRLYGSVSSN